MTTRPKSWKDELAAHERILRDISRVSDPEEVGDIYWHASDAIACVWDAIRSLVGTQPPGDDQTFILVRMLADSAP